MSGTIQEVKADIHDLLSKILEDGQLKSFKLCISAMGEVWIELISSIISKKSKNKEEFIKFFDEALLEMDSDHKMWIKTLANLFYEDNE